jgi:hypothetical protein
MTKTPDPEPTATDHPRPAVEVDVARTGGIAGITRRWSAQPPEAEASEWMSLIDRCPWSEASASTDEGEAAEDARPDSLADSPETVSPTTPAPQPPSGTAERRPSMPDGFVWFIRATWSGVDPREAELPDHELVGAWRELVDAVRGWDGNGGR